MPSSARAARPLSAILQLIRPRWAPSSPLATFLFGIPGVTSLPEIFPLRNVLHGARSVRCEMDTWVHGAITGPTPHNAMLDLLCQTGQVCDCSAALFPPSSSRSALAKFPSRRQTALSHCRARFLPVHWLVLVPRRFRMQVTLRASSRFLAMRVSSRSVQQRTLCPILLHRRCKDRL